MHERWRSIHEEREVVGLLIGLVKGKIEWLVRLCLFCPVEQELMALDGGRFTTTAGWVIKTSAPPASERWALLGSVVCKSHGGRAAALTFLSDIGK